MQIVILLLSGVYPTVIPAGEDETMNGLLEAVAPSHRAEIAARRPAFGLVELVEVGGDVLPALAPAEPPADGIGRLHRLADRRRDRRAVAAGDAQEAERFDRVAGELPRVAALPRFVEQDGRSAVRVRAQLRELSRREVNTAAHVTSDSKVNGARQ